jgi:hypothetical protein
MPFERHRFMQNSELPLTKILGNSGAYYRGSRKLREHEDVKKSRGSIKSESDFTLSLAAKTRQPAIRAHLRGIRQKEIKLFLRQPVLPGVTFIDEVSASDLGEAALERLG